MRASLAIAAALFAAIAPACPPARALQVLVPYAVGGSVDVTTRAITRPLAERLGRPVTVLNVPGASGLVAVQRLMAAPRDGCTMFVGTPNSVVILPLRNPNAAFAPVDLVPVARVGSAGYVLVASVQSGLRDFASLDAAARAARPLRAGHPGADSVQALVLEQLSARLGTSLVFVAYGGAGPMSSDLAGGHIDLAVLAEPAAVPLIQRGAVLSLGPANILDGEPVPSWSGWFVARGVPAAAYDEVRRAMPEVLSDARVRSALADMGVDVAPTGVDEFSAEIQRAVARVRQLRPESVRGSAAR